MITEITPAQKAAIEEYRESVIRSALRTESLDKSVSTQSVIDLYTTSGFKAPKEILFFDSPKAAMVYYKERTKSTTIPSLYFAGEYDMYWLAYYKAAQDILGVKYDDALQKKFDAYLKYANTCGVSYFYEDLALVCDRPSTILFDHLRRLHNLEGPALEFRDGFAVYAWKGTRLSNQSLIKNRFKISPKEILKITNAEERRCATEIYAATHGPDKFIKDMGAKKIAEDVSHNRRVLYDVNGEKFIHVINGTIEENGVQREFMLGAPPNARTPHEAIAESYGRPASMYKEAVRT